MAAPLSSGSSFGDGGGHGRYPHREHQFKDPPNTRLCLRTRVACTYLVIVKFLEALEIFYHIVMRNSITPLFRLLALDREAPKTRRPPSIELFAALPIGVGVQWLFQTCIWPFRATGTWTTTPSLT